MKTISRVLYAIFIFCFILVPSWMFIQSKIYPNEVPNFIGYKPLVILSNSMQPNIDVGNLVIVKTKNEYNVGDIIGYKSDNQNIIIHRITEATSSGFFTKGDANNTTDDMLVTDEIIEGSLITIVPVVGTAILFFRTPLGFIICVILPIIILILMNLDYNKIKLTYRKEIQ